MAKNSFISRTSWHSAYVIYVFKLEALSVVFIEKGIEI